MKLNIQLFAYTKKEWKDLPSKDTPILAADLNNIENQLQTNTNDINALNTNLNKIEDGIETNNKKLSGEEVIGNIVVDSIRTKNMFDKNNVINGYRFGSDGALYADSSYSATSYIEVKPSTTYTYARPATGGSQCICLYDSNKTFISRTLFSEAGTYTFTTTSTTKYVRIAEMTSGLSANIQLEEGSTATTYSPYQNLDKTLDNYSTSEQRIGTWIDGKPIYRKIITKTSFTVGETTNTHGISNIDFIVNVRGVGIRTNGEQEFLPTVVPPSGMQNYQMSVYDVTKTQYRMYMGSYTQTGNQKLETLYLIFEYTKTTD